METGKQMMDKEKVGFIYILTNESFHRENWIKIGYTANVQRRIRELSNTSVPLPYELYASYEIPASKEMEQSDKYLHGLIEQLNPELRLVPNREFFEMAPETAYSLLLALAKIHGRDDKLTDGPGRVKYLQTHTIQQPEQSSEKKPAKLPRMDWCLEQGLIHVGDQFYLKGRPSEIAEVLSDKKVLFNGEEMSYNAFANKVTGWKAIQIYAHLVLVGEKETLAEKREAKMKELGMQ